MTNIESGEVTINKSADTVFQFLADCNNHEKLMPDQVINWQSTATNFSFTIKGTADLALKISETTPGQLVLLEPDGKKPFDFNMKWEISGDGDTSKVTATLAADLNMFLKMVAVKPLENFLAYQAKQLKALLDG